jgi:type IX secretion system substrate protein
MKKIYLLLPLAGLLLLPASTLRAQTVFTDDFNRSSFTDGSTGGTPATTYNFTLGGTSTINTTLVSGSNYVANINSGSTNNKSLFFAPMSVYSSPFNLTLSNNSPAIITWTFNMRTSNAATAIPTSGSVGGGIDLCGNAAGNIYNGAPTGYGVIFNPGATGGVALVKFSGGLNASTAIITQTTTISKTDYYSVRVTFNSSTNAWALYVRDDGAATFADPSTGVTLQQGATTIDNTYVGQAMVNFGAVYTWNSGVGKKMSIDNYTVSSAIPPCSGTPAAGTVTASATNGCGLSYNSNLNLTGSENTTGITYQWQSSTDNITWTPVAGATNKPYTATVTASIYYRCAVTCTNSSTTSYTPGAYLTIQVPVFATVPFNEGFENSWINGCGTADQPDNNWVNTPATGNRSWRRSDDFSTAGWTYGSSGIYSPTSSQGSYSADFCSYSTAAGNSGALSLYINLPAGNKQISYDYINMDGTDFLTVQLSTDGGLTYTTIDAPPSVATVWTTQTIITTSVSATSILRFIATSDFGNSNIGLDNVNVCVLPDPVITGVPVFCFGATTTLSDAFPGGVWSSSNTAIANVGSSSGVVTSAGPGNVVISYSNGCGVPPSITVTVNPLPPVIGGALNACIGVPDTLLDDVGGAWTSSNSSVATIDPSRGIISGSAAGTSSITYSYATGCSTKTTVTVNASPSVIGGVASVCAGSATNLIDGGGGTWMSGNPGLASVGSSSGTVTGVVAGNPVITYTLPDGCSATRIVTVNPVPAPITGASSLCSGATTTLNDASGGGVWSSSATTVATIGTSGVVTGLTGGSFSNISYTFATGCLASKSVTVNSLPTVFSLSIPPGLSSASYCAGSTPPDVQLFSSAIGVNYQLYNGGPVGSPLAGTGSALDFGTQAAAGIYTVIATNGTTGCSKNMTGTVTIGINPVPPASFLTVDNGGNFCAGGAGVDIYDSLDATGITYQLLLGGSPLYTPLPGNTGSNLDFGTGFGVLFNTPGVYTAIATDAVTNCSTNVTGSITVTAGVLPLVYNVTGGGNYCAGGGGIHVGLDNSTTGVNYQLWNGSTLVTTVPGSNSGLDFGLQPAGTYTVAAINAITGCTSNMAGSVTVVMNTLPAVQFISTPGSSTYCPGGAGVDITLNSSDPGIDYQLYLGGTPVGAAMTGTGGLLDYGLQTTTGIYSVIAVDPSSGCTNGGGGAVIVSTYPAMNSFTLGAVTTSYCAGGTGADIQLSGSTSGVQYQLYRDGISLGVSGQMNGTGGLLDFGNQTTVGGPTSVFTVIATSATSCTLTMAGSPAITENTVPVVYTVTGGGGYCAGSAGVNIGLSFSDPGISYQLFHGGVITGSPIMGASSALDFGTFTTTGTYSIVATNSVTTCFSNMTGSAVINVNPLPTVYNVSGGGSYCAGGTGLHVYLSNSDLTANYQLYNGSTPVGSPTAGTGTKLDLGLQTDAGMYTLTAADATSLCSANMNGSSVVTINTIPLEFNVTGGGSYCAGSTGTHVGLSGSTPGISYQLYNGSPMGAAVTGTGAALDFGVQTAAGFYTVAANNVITGCSNNMNGRAIVIVNPLPNPYTVAGGGAYCAGMGGRHIELPASDAGVNYQLFVGGIPAGAAVMGTGAVVDFGAQTASGIYTVAGTNAASGCGLNMTGSAGITVNPAPLAYTITGGGHFCSGGAGLPIYLSGSQTGAKYQLYDGSTAIGSPISGTGAGLNFGAQAMGGTYTAIAADATTGCLSNMTASGTITVDPSPVAFAITGGGHYCAGGAGVLMNLAGSEPGVNYQLFDGGSPSGLPIGGTGTLLHFGLQTAGGTYTITGTNNSNLCSQTMTGSEDITVDPIVTPSVTISSDHGTTSCIGVASTFTANPINGGAGPTYAWKVGGLFMGSGNTFGYIPTDGDLISVTLTSNAACASSTIAMNSLTMNMLPYKMASATVTTNPGADVCQGTNVNFTATPTLGGSTPGYWWLKNSVVAGTGTTFDYTPTSADNGDVIEFMLKTSYLCPLADTVFSEPVVMTVDANSLPAFSISAHLGPKIGVGQVDTFVAAVTPVNGSVFTYQWNLLNTRIPGATSQMYIDYSVFDGDNITCTVTREGACGNQSLAKSTIVHLSDVGVNPVVTTGSDIRILPNPNKGEFTIQGNLGNTNDEEVSMEITDMIGQVVYSNKVNTVNGSINQKIQLSRTIANGMYILNLRSASAINICHIVVEQ